MEYRQQPFEVSNVFAAVEIKFPNDWVKGKQMKDYVDLMGNNSDKVALLRVPEDCTGFRPYTPDKEGIGGHPNRRGK
ncbi:hypothetical protein D3C87_1695780 [compost metagenome]